MTNTPVAGLPAVNAPNGATSNLFLLDQILAKRDLLKKVYPEFDDEIWLNSFAARIQAIGSERMVDNLLASHYQKKSVFTKVEILSIAANTTFDAEGALITYKTTSVSQSSTTIGNSLFYSPGTVQEVVMTAGNPLRALIKQKNAPTGSASGHSIIVVGTNGGTYAQLAAQFAANKFMTFGGATKSELQTFGVGDIQFFDRYDWIYQKLPGFTPLMSNEFNSALNVMSDGSAYPMTQTVALNLLKMQVRRALSLVIGSGSIFNATNGSAANEVEGIWTIGRNHGLSQDWDQSAIADPTTGNAVLYALLTAVGRYAIANQLGSNLEWCHGQENGIQIQNFINTGGIAAGNTYNNYNAQQDGADRLINFASQGIILPNNVRLDLVAEPAFNHPTITSPDPTVANNYFPYAAYVNPKMKKAGAFNKALGTYGQVGGPTDIEILVYGQTQGMEMKDKVKTLSVYQGPAITNTEAGAVKWTTQYTLRLASVNRTISVGPIP